MSKVYQIITDRIISLLEEGTVPWQKPWSTPNHKPRNFHSGKAYRGINPFMLSCAGFDSPYWLTFKQAKERGGTVRKGERYSPCIFWTEWKREDKQTGEKERIPVLRFYKIWNAEQIDGIDFPEPEKPRGDFEPIQICESVVAEMPNPPRIEIPHANAWRRPVRGPPSP